MPYILYTLTVFRRTVSMDKENVLIVVIVPMSNTIKCVLINYVEFTRSKYLVNIGIIKHIQTILLKNKKKKNV